MATVLDEPPINRQHLAHRLDGGIAAQAAIGLIVLATDQTIEHEFRHLLDLPGVALYESRILNDAQITPETLRAMEGRLVEATGLILPGLPLDVVAFGCTSASMVIGEEARLRANSGRATGPSPARRRSRPPSPPSGRSAQSGSRCSRPIATTSTASCATTSRRAASACP